MLNPWTLDERCQRRARDQSRGGEEMEADCAAPRQGHEQKNRAICKRKYKKKMKKHKTKSVGRVAVESVVLIARNCLFLLLSTQPSGPLWLHVATVAHWAGWGRAHCCVDAARAPLRPPVCVPTTDGSGDGCAIGLLYLDHATSCHCIAGPHGCFTREYRGNICLLWLFSLPLSRCRGCACSTEH